MTASAACLHHDQPSPFTGADVCRLAGLGLPGDARRPVFEGDLWDFTDVIGLPVEMALANRRLDFAAITDTRWRLVTKELVLAMLAPQDLRITSVSHALLARSKACASFSFTGCCWRRSLAVGGGSGTSRGHARKCVGQVIGGAAKWPSCRDLVAVVQVRCAT